MSLRTEGIVITPNDLEEIEARMLDLDGLYEAASYGHATTGLSYLECLRWARHLAIRYPFSNMNKGTTHGP